MHHLSKNREDAEERLAFLRGRLKKLLADYAKAPYVGKTEIHDKIISIKQDIHNKENRLG